MKYIKTQTKIFVQIEVKKKRKKLQQTVSKIEFSRNDNEKKNNAIQWNK